MDVWLQRVKWDIHLLQCVCLMKVCFVSFMIDHGDTLVPQKSPFNAFFVNVYVLILPGANELASLVEIVIRIWEGQG